MALLLNLPEGQFPVVATLLSFVPVVLLVMPLKEILEDLAKLLL